MSPAELIECLSLIGSQHGIGRQAGLAPGRGTSFTTLRPRRFFASRQPRPGESGDADVCLRLADGRLHRAEPGRSQLIAGELRVTLWSGRFDTAPDPAAFDFGISFGFDRVLFEDDVTGSIAWADALAGAGVSVGGGSRRRLSRHSKRSSRKDAAPRRGSRDRMKTSTALSSASWSRALVTRAGGCTPVDRATSRSRST